MTSTNTTTSATAAAASSPSRFMPSLSYSAERLDSHHHGACESSCFLASGTAGQQPGPQCRLGYLPNFAVEPSYVSDWYAASNFRSLTLVAEINDSVVNSRDEPGRLRFEPFGVPASAGHDRRSPPAHRASPVGDQVSRLGRQARRAIFENRRIRPARHVAAVFAVPVRQQHDDDLQAVELPRADKRVVVPCPAVFVKQ